MKTTISRTWEFRTYSIQGRCKCAKCGKPIIKTFSFQTREDVPTVKEDWDYIEKQKEEWLSESHICNSCKRKKVTQERKDITLNYTFMFSKLDELQNQIKQIVKDKVQRVKSIKDIEGKVLIDKNGIEWFIERISEGSQNNLGFELRCYRINKQKPWLCTDDCRYFTSNTTMWSNYSTLEGCAITDEVFSDRKELL